MRHRGRPERKAAKREACSWFPAFLRNRLRPVLSLKWAASGGGQMCGLRGHPGQAARPVGRRARSEAAEEPEAGRSGSRGEIAGNPVEGERGQQGKTGGLAGIARDADSVAAVQRSPRQLLGEQTPEQSVANAPPH